MDYYRTNAVVRLAAGTIVGLSEDLATDRAGRIDPVDKRDGVYELRDPLHFKQGELVGLDELPPKVLWRRFEGGESGDPPTAFDADGKERSSKKAAGGKSAGDKPRASSPTSGGAASDTRG